MARNALRDPTLLSRVSDEKQDQQVDHRYEEQMPEIKAHGDG